MTVCNKRKTTGLSNSISITDNGASGFFKYQGWGSAACLGQQSFKIRPTFNIVTSPPRVSFFFTCLIKPESCGTGID